MKHVINKLCMLPLQKSTGCAIKIITKITAATHKLNLKNKTELNT